jgi:DNA-binding beta-propeller fold protein YncE
MFRKLVVVTFIALLVCLVFFALYMRKVLARQGGRSDADFLVKVVDLPLPGAAVRFDYQSLDPTQGRLYIAHMNADQLVVFDVKNNRVVANLDGFPRVHGVWAVAELDRIYASATGEHKVAVVNRTTLKTIARVGPVNYPDGLAYVPGVARVFVSDEHGQLDAVIDTGTNMLIKTIPLGGGAGNTVYDPGSGNVLVGVHDRNELVTIDPTRMEITHRLKLSGGEDPHGIAIDGVNHLAFVACEGSAKLFVVDLRNMSVLGEYPVGRDPDVLAFDPGLGVLYVSAESGEVTIFRENKKKLELVQHFSEPHAHTVAVDPDTHLVYFPLENIGGHPVLRIMKPTQGI